MAGRPPAGSATGKKRLLDACWKLLREQPVAKPLTIAAVCEEAGCTPPTLYHHFGDLDSLRRAASRRAHLEWSEEMALSTTSDGDPKQQIRDGARVYLEWAIEHPDAYHVMFSQPRREDDPNPHEETIDTPSFVALRTYLAELHDMPLEDPSIILLALNFWAAVHGLASLSVTMPFFPAEVRESVMATTIDALLAQPLPAIPANV